MTNAGERQLGHYTIIRQLGAGGMGEVYLADDKRLARKVAVKVLPADLTRNDEAKRRLLREARSVAALDHPNVCTVHEVDEQDGRLYIVMQYVEGETLADRLSRERMPLNTCIDVAMEIASALQEAHSHGVVHRDIKPANVMINVQGQVKVLDFGLAKSAATIEQSATDLLVSKAGTISGTAPYMSPEQIRGSTVDGRSDIFSLGIVLYEIAAGARPFDRPSAVGTITAILFDPPPPLTREEFKPLQPVIDTCLAKNPNDRYQTAADLRGDLQALREGRATTAEARTGVREARLAPKHDVDPEAEQLVLKGRVQWNKRHPEAGKQGIDLIQRAKELDSLSPIISVARGIPPHYGRRYKEALTLYHAVIETEAAFAPAHYYIGLTYEQLGEYDQALHHFERSMAISGRISFFFA